jgi:antitoxin FitA
LLSKQPAPAHVIAYRGECIKNASMATQITIHNVPEKVREELAARAALQGKSMQEYLRAHLERLAAHPSMDAWLEQVRKRKQASRTRVSSGHILKERDADRR